MSFSRVAPTSARASSRARQLKPDAHVGVALDLGRTITYTYGLGGRDGQADEGGRARQDGGQDRAGDPSLRGARAAPAGVAIGRRAPALRRRPGPPGGG